MDATLITNSERHFLCMQDIRIFGDDSGGVCRLDLRSSPFQAQIDFFFDSPALSDFVTQLERLKEHLIGKAWLGNDHEELFIQFDGDGLGHILVSGKLLDSTCGRMQQLAFEFQTDQTALMSFIGDLKAVAAGSL